MILFYIFISFIVWFLITDFIYWKSGRETMSQYVIQKTRRNKFLKWFIIILMFGVAGVLTWHWELV